jgi:hypothetical protein
MSNDPHPRLRNRALLDGLSEHADFDPEGFATTQQIKMVLHPPESRMQALQSLDEAMADESVPLKQRSQLLQLRRRMALTHEQLLKVGR